MNQPWNDCKLRWLKFRFNRGLCNKNPNNFGFIFEAPSRLENFRKLICEILRSQAKFVDATKYHLCTPKPLISETSKFNIVHSIITEKPSRYLYFLRRRDPRISRKVVNTTQPSPNNLMSFHGSASSSYGIVSSSYGSHAKVSMKPTHIIPWNTPKEAQLRFLGSPFGAVYKTLKLYTKY